MNMNINTKRLISVCGIMLLLAGILSCASSRAAERPDSSIVWKVSKNGNTLLLAGSIHILRDSDYPLPEEFDRAFAQAAVLVLETDIDQLADESMVQYLASQMILPDGQTLHSLLDPDVLGMLDEECNKYGFSVDDVLVLKPSMIINILTMLQVQKYGFTGEGVDAFFLNKAKQENKPVDFLETVMAQIDMLITMGDGYENDYVRYSLQDISNTEDDLATLVAEWKEGNASSTIAALTEMSATWPVIYKALLADRNAAWMPKLEEYLASGQVYFVIVGLAHLYGPDGLLIQLEKSGCTLERF